MILICNKEVGQLASHLNLADEISTINVPWTNWNWSIFSWWDIRSKAKKLSIKPKEISKIILEELKTEIGPSEIIIKKEINKIGQFEININLHSEVQTRINLIVEKLDKLQNK